MQHFLATHVIPALQQWLCKSSIGSARAWPSGKIKANNHSSPSTIKKVQHNIEKSGPGWNWMQVSWEMHFLLFQSQQTWQIPYQTVAIAESDSSCTCGFEVYTGHDYIKKIRTYWNAPANYGLHFGPIHLTHVTRWCNHIFIDTNDVQMQLPRHWQSPAYW